MAAATTLGGASMPEQLGIGMIGCGEIAVQTARGMPRFCPPRSDTNL